MGKIKRLLTPGNIINVVAFVVIMVICVVVFERYWSIFSSAFDREDKIEGALIMRDILLSYGNASAFVFIGLLAIQVVITFIPGAVVQFAAGVIYGTLGGFGISQVGILAGSFLSFYIARVFGTRVVDALIPSKHINRLNEFVNDGNINGSRLARSDLVLLALFVIPGFPKDCIAYALGLTKMNGLKFLIISSVGRTPGILVSCYMGATLMSRNYTAVIVVSVVTVIMFLGIYTLFKRSRY